MKNKINLGMNVTLEIVDTDFAKSFDVRNHQTKMQINLGQKLK